MPEQPLSPGAASRSSALVVFDLDRTITRFDTYLPFLCFVCLHRPARLLCGLTLLPAVWGYLRGRENNSWLKERFWTCLAGQLSADDVCSWGLRYARLICRYGLRPGALARIDHHKASGDRLVLVSASFDIYVSAIGTELGFHDVLSTQAEISEEELVTGRLDGPNCYGEEKVVRLNEHLGNDLQIAERVAYSDHHSDIALFEWADRGVAVHPTKLLRQRADELSLKVVCDWS